MIINGSHVTVIRSPLLAINPVVAVPPAAVVVTCCDIPLVTFDEANEADDNDRAVNVVITLVAMSPQAIDAPGTDAIMAKFDGVAGGKGLQLSERS